MVNNNVQGFKKVSNLHATHYCFYCDAFLSMIWMRGGKTKENKPSSGCYLTTTADKHLEKCRLNDKKAVNALIKREKENLEKGKIGFVSKLNHFFIYYR